MSRLTPARGLQPSLLDRLIDPESAGTAMMTGYNADQMYQAVLRDLEDLLNTRQSHRPLPAAFPETAASIVAYGLPDLISAEATTADQRAAVGRAIERVIKRFEPRLKAVRVVLLNPGENLVRGSLRFQVDARLNADPAPDVSFETVLEMASGKYLVTRAAA